MTPFLVFPATDESEDACAEQEQTDHDQDDSDWKSLYSTDDRAYPENERPDAVAENIASPTSDCLNADNHERDGERARRDSG